MTLRSHSLRAAPLLLWAVLQGCAMFGHNGPRMEQKVERSIARGDTAGAVKLLGQWTNKGHAPPEAYLRLGVLLRSDRSITGRRRMQETLERALQIYPDHAGLMLELGKTYYRQTFYGDAARLFERVLQVDPRSCEAQYWLAKNWYRKWKHVQVYREYLQKARSLARQVVGCAPDNAHALYMLAFSLYALGDSAEAVQRMDDYIALYPDEPRGHMLRGVVEFERHQPEDCERLFSVGCSLSTEEEAANLESIALLLDDDAREQYERRSPEQRADQHRMFWAQLDPDPTTPINERYLEHVYRMFLADQYYQHDRPPLRGWETERGRALVKFGWPEALGSTLAGTFTSGRMEVWHYANARNAFTLFFRDEFLNGNYIVPMDYHYSYAAQTLFLEEPSTAYLSPYALVPGLIELFAFRNDGVATEVHVAVAIDADSMNTFLYPDSPSQLYVRSAVFGPDWAPLEYRADTLSTPESWGGPPPIEPYYIVRRFQLGFGKHRLALTVEDDLARTQTLMQDEANTLRFLSDSLLLSDIVLHRGLARNAQAAVIRRGENVFVPNPGRSYEAGEKLRLYFEVYNLDVRRSSSHYEITYSIFDEPKDVGGWARFKRGLDRMAGVRSRPDPVISQTIERRGSRHSAEENLAINIDALRPGNYVLRVMVRDRSSGETTSGGKVFVKVENVREGR